MRSHAPPPRYRGLHRVLYQHWNYAQHLKPDAADMDSALFDIDLLPAPPGSYHVGFADTRYKAVLCSIHPTRFGAAEKDWRRACWFVACGA